jgi:hypothetical protein
LVNSIGYMQSVLSFGSDYVKQYMLITLWHESLVHVITILCTQQFREIDETQDKMDSD